MTTTPVKKASPRPRVRKPAAVKPAAPKPVVHKIQPAKELAVKPVLKHTSYDYLATVGRRKEAVARVRLFRKGTGQISINNQELVKYFSTFDTQYTVQQPLKLLGLESAVDIRVKVSGGGKFGQADAVRHGIARALLLMDENYRKQLRPAGFLTRDSRVKERKKPGLKRARRAPQFSKR